jgi:hypothetical protein
LQEANHDLWLELEHHLIQFYVITGNITGLKSGVHYQVRVVLVDKDGGSYKGPNVLPADIITQCTGLCILEAFSLSLIWRASMISVNSIVQDIK